MLANADTVTGFEVLMGALGYTFQLYADFSGGIDIVIGIAQILGITLTPNFKRPYFSVSLADYWRRWHITLGAWMRDYVFYSIAMSKGFGKFISRSKKIFGQQFGLLLPSVLLMGFIFLLIGIWHGAEWKYIFYGLYNSVIIMAGMIFTPILTKANDRFHLVDTTAFSWRVLLTAMTFCLIVIGRIITVSHGLHQGLHLVKAMVTTFNPWIIFDGTLYTLGLDKPDLVVLCFAIGILIIVSILQESGMKVRETLDRQNLWFRWFICISAILVILVFGVYGDLDFASSEFIYQQF
jgi:D-alanyl-lipoteichoic acid acyltransferase DltB (MBOAT superfamily)